MLGCGATTTVTATHMMQPVLLGKVTKIGGTVNTLLQRKEPFSIGAIHALHEGGYIGNPIAAELSNLTDAREEIVIIDAVFVGSSSFLIILKGGNYDEKSWVELKGSIYQSQDDMHEAN